MNKFEDEQEQELLFTKEKHDWNYLKKVGVVSPTKETMKEPKEKEVLKKLKNNNIHVNNSNNNHSNNQNHNNPDLK